MNVTIYVDILFFLNLIINYILLAATSIIANREHTKSRILLGAFVGAIYSVLIFFSNVSFLSWNVMKIVMCAFIVLISFKYRSILGYLKLILSFYIVSLVFGGGMLCFRFFTSAGANMNYSNGVFYIDMPLWVIILLGFLFYGVIKLFSRAFYMKLDTKNHKKITIIFPFASIKTDALIDTGNSLYDPITFTPVMLLEIDKIREFLPSELIFAIENETFEDIDITKYNAMKMNIRIIPCRTVGKQTGFILALKPKKVIFEDKKREIDNILVGISPQRLSPDKSYSALLHSSV